MAFDNSGNFYVVNGNGNSVEKYSSSGADLGSFASSGLSGPNYLAFSVATQTSQTISAFTTIPTQTYPESSFTITLPTATSGLPVTVTVKSGPATISSNTITLTGSGTVTLAADQAGNATYAPAPEVTTSFAVNSAPQTISM